MARRLASSLLAVLLVTTPATAGRARLGAAGGLCLETLQTPEGAERYQALPANPPGPWVGLYCLPAPDLEAGEVLHVTADAEVTNDVGPLIGFAHQLRLSPSCDDFAGGIELDEAQSQGLTTSGMHHLAITRTGLYEAPAASRGGYLVLFVRAMSSWSGATQLRVEGGYGGLRALHFYGC